MTTPLLSFIVLSYNYERFIATTLQSILAQTVQDFEIVVIDDCSSDGSCNVVNAFHDPRIKLSINQTNLGGAGSYNRAVALARGDWLVNLDADDWIAPQKSAMQLDAVTRDPAIDIIGTWVSVVDARGSRHAQADNTERHFNRHHRLDLVETWLGTNPICRSSTMVRRSAHLRIGLDDAAMVRAPDYELWTRALVQGCRFELLPETLTFMRQHDRSVTHADPTATLLEVAYAMIRNLAPLAERRSLFEAHGEMVRWIARHSNLTDLRPMAALHLLASMQTLPKFNDYMSFQSSLDAEDALAERIGRQALLSARNYVDPGTIEKLYADIELYIEARDYWIGKAEAKEADANQ